MAHYSDLARVYGTVTTADGTELALSSAGDFFDNTTYRATAYPRDPAAPAEIDEDNPYLVDWEILPEILATPAEDRPEDSSEWCNWDKCIITDKYGHQMAKKGN